MASKALLLLCMLALAGGAVATNRKSETITVLLSVKDGEIVGTSGYDEFPTSYATWAASVFDFRSLKPKGFLDGVSTVLKVRPTYTVLLGTFVYDTGSAQITTSGVIVTDKAVNYLAITGGTGKYKGVSGEVSIETLTEFLMPPAVLEYKLVMKIDF